MEQEEGQQERTKWSFDHLTWMMCDKAIELEVWGNDLEMGIRRHASWRLGQLPSDISGPDYQDCVHPPQRRGGDIIRSVAWGDNGGGG